MICAASAVKANRPLSPDWSAELEVAIEVGSAAGDVALRYFTDGVEPSWKAARDPVTAADLAVEQTIREQLAAAFGDDLIVGEEGGHVAESNVAGQRRWYVDPIDGTMNFMKGSDRWATTVAFCDADDRISAAVVVRPTTGEVFSADRGGGAWCGPKRLQVSPTQTLDHAMVGVGVLSPHEAGSAALTELSREAMGLRVSGSTVCDLCDVAAGTLDAFWQATIVKRWDLAAGTLLVTEAGGTVTSADGILLTGPAESIIAGAPALHPQLAQLLG